MKERVYAAIKKMVTGKTTPAPIGVDSLALVMRIKEADLVPFIEELVQDGLIIYEPSTSNSRRRKSSGSIMITEEGT